MCSNHYERYEFGAKLNCERLQRQSKSRRTRKNESVGLGVVTRLCSWVQRMLVWWLMLNVQTGLQIANADTARPVTSGGDIPQGTGSSNLTQCVNALAATINFRLTALLTDS